MTIDAWNHALLEELLPLSDDELRTPVLLACDEETVRAAARRIHLAPDDGVTDLTRHVRVAYGVALDDLKRLPLDGASFAHAMRPRPVPRFLAVLCVSVLAASRMHSDEQRPTQAYYPILRDLLKLPSAGDIEGFPHLSRLLHLLSEWLEDDEGGHRGTLILPHDPSPAWVGYPISQTVFRERDREVLSRFFAERLALAREGLDSLRLLRRWSGRSALTGHAQAIVANDQLADAVRAAIEAARRSWDGSVLARGGARIWTGRLRLGLSPTRLLVSSTNPDTLQLDGQSVTLTLHRGSEAILPWEALPVIGASSLMLQSADRLSSLRVVSLGDTILFQIGVDEASGFNGLWQVPAVSDDRAWVLTRDPSLTSRCADYAELQSPVPSPWVLLGDLPIQLLPERYRARDGATLRQSVFALEGGLEVERLTYLIGGGPLLVAGVLDDDPPIRTEVDGILVGLVSSGGRIQLPATHPGRHHLVVGEGLYTRAYEVVDHGVHEPSYGQLGHDLTQPSGALRGAMAHGTSSTRMVCGAIVSPAPPVRFPIMRQSRHPVYVIRRTGGGAWHHYIGRPRWLQLPGVIGDRWEIPGDDVLWVICLRTGDAIRWQPGKPESVNPSTAEVLRQAGPTPRLHDHLGETAAASLEWRALYDTNVQAGGA